jgi:hypothetical protein
MFCLMSTSLSYGESLPSFVCSVPSGHFAGISEPCASIAEARRGATIDVVRQILGSVGITYNYRSVHDVSGDPRIPQRSIDDYLSGTGGGLVEGVSENIVRNVVDVRSGRYVCYMLVRYPRSLIERVRRLSKGAHVVLSAERVDGGIRLRITETNDVAVTFASLSVTVSKRNRFAQTISYYIWKVPAGSSQAYEVAFNPVTVRSGSASLRLPLDLSCSVGDFFLGSDVTVSVQLRGVDEVGRVFQASLPHFLQ